MTGEATESDDALLLSAAAYMESAPRITERRKAQPAPSVPPQLPFSCVGLGCVIRAKLEALAAKCGQDKACWQAEMDKEMEMTSQPMS